MSRSFRRSALYRLIEAGQLGRLALMAPLRERGLEPGDEAVLLVLGTQSLSEDELGARTGLGGPVLRARIEGLMVRDFLRCDASQATSFELTERGLRAASSLEAHWADLEETLLEGLDGKGRKSLRIVLKRFADSLLD